ncbi:MAG: metalloregulator ArsR/SmtB family transcription factor [Acidobacteriota bacterium]|nr:MAG: metalloregulator ArsR/SmtB family transcription factor [Acidobacteriota bacterium]
MAGKNVFKLDEIFAALADRTRLRLLNLMRDGEVCVCFFAETLGTNNPKISRHLAYLKRAGLVNSRREGKWVHYSLRKPENEGAAAIVETALKAFEADAEMLSDREKLTSVCCELMPTPVAISRAGRK